MSEQKPKEPLLAVLLNCVFTGLGHIYAGSTKIGLSIIATLILLGALIFSWIIHPQTELLFLEKLSGNEESLLGVLELIALLIIMAILFDSYRRAKKYNSEKGLERKITTGKRITLIFGIIVTFCGLNLNTVLAFPIALSIRTYVVQAFKIPSGTMNPTLIKGDRLLVYKSAYSTNKPERGDIVVFIYPEDTSRDFIKRLIAKGGETVEIKDGDIYIDGHLITDSRIKNTYYYNRGEYGNGSVKVPEGNYFVLGDNSGSSMDSRFWGFVPAENLVGKAYKIYYPFNRSGPIE